MTAVPQIFQPAFEAFMLAYEEHGGTGLGFRKCLEAYEAAKTISVMGEPPVPILPGAEAKAEDVSPSSPATKQHILKAGSPEVEARVAPGADGSIPSSANHQPDEFTLLGVLADIRQKTGIGDKVMLADLADTLAALIQNGDSAIDTNKRLAEKLPKRESVNHTTFEDAMEAECGIRPIYDEKKQYGSFQAYWYGWQAAFKSQLMIPLTEDEFVKIPVSFFTAESGSRVHRTIFRRLKEAGYQITQIEDQQPKG